MALMTITTTISTNMTTCMAPVISDWSILLPSMFFPATTIAQWIGVLVLLFSTWGVYFFGNSTPKSILRDHAAKKARIQELAQAALLYSQEEMKKEKIDRKLPEPSRIRKLLWDEVRMCRTTAYGINADSDLYKAMNQMLKDVFTCLLQETITLTQQARDLRASDGAAKAAFLKTLKQGDAKRIATYESGEKLNDQLKFAKETEKYLGKGFFDKSLLTNARQLAKQVYLDQSQNVVSLLHLMWPAIPTTLVSIVLGIVVTVLRARFHQIGLWVDAAQAGANGDIARAKSLLFNLWVGHMLIKIIELPVSTYESYAKSVFNRRIKNGVLAAMVRQDYEYFKQNSPGVLQERLNRDADELGENLLGFPKKMLEKFVWVGTNLYIVYRNTPLPFFLVAILPVAVQIITQYFAFAYFQREATRQRKIEEESVIATSEVLRQLKTVRQFAMESRASTEYAAKGLSTQVIAQSVYLMKRTLEQAVWAFFDCGITLTLLIGFPYVASGTMTASILIDSFCKLNFNVNFCLRQIMEEIPKAAKILEPLGRICDLLQSRPVIEGSSEAFVDCADPSALRAVLRCCKSVPSTVPGATAVTRVVKDVDLAALCSPAQRADTSPNRTVPAKANHLVALKTADHQHIVVTDIAALAEVNDLTFPVRAIFSTKLRPAKFAGKIEFRNVHFSYPTDLRTPALQGINLMIQPGQKVALVGASGCGKSTCMLLVQRLYDPLEGTVLIDDRDIKEYDIRHLRSRIVIVDQNTVLFNKTIRENITFGMVRDVTDEEVVQALKDAQIWEFVDSKPDKLLHMISENGSNLSGGERQRLAIARAIIRKPDVILLDEATSALDNENEAKVQKALDILAKHGSALAIAHRLGTIKDSNKICLIDQGVVAEEGTHHELLLKGKEHLPSGSPSYTNLWDMATGIDVDKMSAQQLCEKIEQMQNDIAACKRKQEEIKVSSGLSTQR